MKNTALLLLFWQRNRVSPNSLNPFPNLRIRVGWGPAALLPSACAGRFLNRQFRGVGAHGSKQMGMGVNGNCLWLDLFLRVFSHDFIETSLITSDDLWGWQALNMLFFFLQTFYFALGYIRFTMLWQVQVNIEGTQPYEDTFSSVAQSCPPLCDPMRCSTPGFPVHHQLPELA